MRASRPGVADASVASLAAAIDALGLPPGPTTHLHDRWLGQLTWFEAKASKNQKSHRSLRMVALIGGVMLPLAVNAAASDASTLLRIAAVLVSVLVAVAVATESFLRPGERWIQFRQTAELLRSEWWLFVSLAGDYAGYTTVADAHKRFVERVESIVGADVAGFVALVTPSTAPPGQPDTVTPPSDQQG